MAAKLIAPMIDDSFSSGYNWCVDSIKMSQHSQLANDLEINKAVMYLKQKDFTNAVDTLKAFEKQDTKVASTAATNLSFLYFLQGEKEQAEKYADLARESDSYNAGAFVNLANCSFDKGDVEKAKELYQRIHDQSKYPGNFEECSKVPQSTKHKSSHKLHVL